MQRVIFLLGANGFQVTFKELNRTNSEQEYTIKKGAPQQFKKWLVEAVWALVLQPHAEREHRTTPQRKHKTG